jgi:hypothetical protein
MSVLRTAACRSSRHSFRTRHLLARGAWLSLIACLWALPVSAQPLTFSRDDVPTSAGARAIVTADFDGNGWPDIAHANTGRNTVTVQLNRVDGEDGLSGADDIPVGTGPFDLVAADFNHDNVPDLAVANADNDTITVLLGARGRGFPTRTTIAAPGNPRGIAAADMNRDGNVDIIYTAYSQRAARVVLGNGSGGFGPGAWKTYSVWYPQGVVAADFNHDGWVDLAVASVSTLGLDIFYGSGSSMGYGSTQFNTPSKNVVAAGDFNGDGELDVAAASSTSSRLTVYLGPGYTSQATYTTGTSPRGLITADLNGDGLLDLVTGNRGDNTVSVLLGTGGGAFAAAMNVPSGTGSRGVVAADFDHDGRLDLATGNELAATTTVLSNQIVQVPAARAFERVKVDSGGTMFPLAVADFNHNGLIDIVLQGRVLLDGTRSVALPGRPEQMAAVGDFNRDGRPDIARAGYADGAVNVLLGDGAGGFTTAWQAPFRGYYIFAVDMNNDGATDLVVSGSTTGSSTLIARFYRGNGDGTFTAVSDMPLGGGSSLNIDVADVNRDGKLDIVVPHSASGSSSTVIVFVGDGLGSTLRAEEHVVGSHFGDVKVADVNEDGRNDLVVGLDSGVGTDIAILFGRPDGGFGAAVRYPATGIPGRYANTYQLEVADVNHDGHVDIVYQSLLLGHGNGFFDAAEFELGWGHPLFVDYNRDGTTDIVNWDSDGVSVLLNLRTDANRPPTGVEAGPDRHFEYLDIFTEEACCAIEVQGSDPDRHALKYEWRTSSGELVGYGQSFVPSKRGSGTHHLVLTVTDGHGGEVSDTVTVTIDPYAEIVANMAVDECCGAWNQVNDPTAAGGMRMHHPNANAPKLASPVASPQNYIERHFVADPSQVYKLWVRMKAENNVPSNDSVFVQFTGAVDQAGTAYAIGTTSALALNLETCSGCGLAGWGWRDERWGPAQNGAPVLLRFPNGGWQTIRIQTREDGVSIDEFVLSGQEFRSTAPGGAKNDTHMLWDTTRR